MLLYLLGSVEGVRVGTGSGSSCTALTLTYHWHVVVLSYHPSCSSQPMQPAGRLQISTEPWIVYV